MGDPILPMFSLCLSAVEVWDSSFQWTSVFLVGIEESSGIEWEILWTSLNQYGKLSFFANCKAIMEYYEYFLPLAGILICWLFAKNILMEEKIKKLSDRVKNLEDRDSSL